MSDQSVDAAGDVAARLKKLVNSHGEAFQATVLEFCDSVPILDMGSVLRGRWTLSTPEFPVTVGGREFHVDGVLTFESSWSDDNLHRMVAVECKRPDPSLSEWAFASTHGENELIADCFVRGEGGDRVVAEVGFLTPVSFPMMTYGTELKGSARGDGTGRALKEAVEQAFRGSSGVADLTADLVPPGHRLLVVPLIVTTARLYVTTRLLSEADLKTGELADTPTSVVNCVWLSVNVSRSLLPTARPVAASRMSSSSVYTYLRRRHKRAVLVANVDGLPEALGALARLSFHLIRAD